jgi:hypothetical protein
MFGLTLPGTFVRRSPASPLGASRHEIGDDFRPEQRAFVPVQTLADLRQRGTRRVIALLRGPQGEPSLFERGFQVSKARLDSRVAVLPGGAILRPVESALSTGR